MQNRDASLAGRFVFGVTTTGIYCRPGCPSPRPRRDNVRFFATTAAARTAGFRACRRCHPDDVNDASRNATGNEATARLRDTDLRLLVSHIDAALADGGRPSVASLAAAVGLAPVVFRQRLEATLGIGPRALLSGRQLARLRERLLAGDDVTDALYSAGYGSSSRLYERAQEGLGMTPGAYRRGGAGVAIGWTTAPSPLGLLLVATTIHGVCAVYLGDSEATLRDALEAEFPRATITRGVNRNEWVAAAVAVASGQALEDVPLDLQGTAFQQRVWLALRAIPRGETRTYAQLAAMIGQPTAVRAAARACATNKVSLLVPCHRVVGSDASLTGYRWGVERKRRLLDLERGQNRL
ncbi:Regulatory protein of adaptative response [Luteitalea pratensis]|uniref:methylated-DNA--[protein]-cysteine S-methyltransferase n=1 Tax=Luteitalea pratensis TaxID=1855912 RepID=A0A143PWZ8_LUTPR|nr:Regulatory protein of adaptative response [Luteitalea pratensis]